jgi:hypothetical protein
MNQYKEMIDKKNGNPPDNNPHGMGGELQKRCP